MKQSLVLFSVLLIPSNASVGGVLAAARQGVSLELLNMLINGVIITYLAIGAQVHAQGRLMSGQSHR